MTHSPYASQATELRPSSNDDDPETLRPAVEAAAQWVNTLRKVLIGGCRHLIFWNRCVAALTLARRGGSVQELGKMLLLVGVRQSRGAARVVIVVPYYGTDRADTELPGVRVYSSILYSVTDAVATITLNRPEKLNAFIPVMRDELLQAFDAIDRDDDVRVVIVTGAGRAFCAGGEVVERPASDHQTSERAEPAEPDDGGIIALRMFRCLKPMIAACNGAAVGFGATFQLPMDIRLASEKARFGFPFANLGVVPEAAASWFLPRLVGVSRAIEWCLTGQLVSASEAQAAGLVRSVHKPEELMPAARALARTIADRAAPVSAALTRLMLWQLASAEHPMQAHIVESKILRDRKRQRDLQEGIASFLQKRPAVFPDRVSRDLPPCVPWRDEPAYR